MKEIPKMIFLTPYNTTACHGHVLSTTIDAILKSAVSDNSLDGNIKKAKDVWCLVDKGASSQAPAFGQPIVLDKVDVIKYTRMFGESNSHDSRFFAVIDARPYTSYDENNGTVTIKNRLEFNLAMLRASLTEYWVNGGVSSLQSFSTLPMSIFASWISENVARRYNLDVREQVSLSVYAAYYYLSLFTNDEIIDNQERNRFAMMISKALRISASEVLDIIERTEPPQNIGDFCSRAEGVIGSVRLKEFNKLVLFSLIGGTWFGINAKENVCVALEHPPTWISLLTAAYSERGFTKSGITQLIERNSNRNLGQNYTRQVFSLVQFEI